MANTRLYSVKHKATGIVRLIEAATPSGARNFVARDDFDVVIPPQHEIFALAKAGVEIEKATDAPISETTRASVSQSCIEG